MFGQLCLWGAELPCCFLQEALQLLMESAPAFPSSRKPAGELKGRIVSFKGSGECRGVRKKSMV